MRDIKGYIYDKMINPSTNKENLAHWVEENVRKGIFTQLEFVQASTEIFQQFWKEVADAGEEAKYNGS